MRPMNLRAYCWSALSFVCVAMGAGLLRCNNGEESPRTDASVDCHGFASAYCARRVACDPVATRQYFGDFEACTARMTLDCLGYAGTGWTSRQIDHCAEQIRTAPGCYVRGWTAECEFPTGTLPSGSACDVVTQCASLACVFSYRPGPDGGSQLPLCGVCEGPAAGPPRCGNAPACQPGERCASAGGGQCIVPQPEGAPCESVDDCEDGLFCQRQTSGTGMAVCSRQRSAGAACTDEEGCCNTKDGLRCIGGVCDVPTFVPVGAECDSGSRICENGALCLDPMPLSTPPGTRTCVGPVDDGSPCVALLSAPCRQPALCRAGQCRLPGDAQCRVP
jgi:hypothetical protein